MPTRKIRDLDPEERCVHPEHNPPMHRVYDPGVYEHVCPSCGKKTEFTVRRPFNVIAFSSLNAISAFLCSPNDTALDI